MTLEDYRPRRPGRPQKYPWDFLLDGVAKLVSDADLRRWEAPSREAFRASALQEARRRKITLRTSAFSDQAIALVFPPQSLFEQSRVDWSTYFDGARREWSFSAVPFGMAPTAWLDRLKAEAVAAGFTPEAQINEAGHACAFRVVRDDVARPDIVAAEVEEWVEDDSPLVDGEWEDDDEPLDEPEHDRVEDSDGIPLRVVIGAPAAGGDA